MEEAVHGGHGFGSYFAYNFNLVLYFQIWCYFGLNVVSLCSQWGCSLGTFLSLFIAEFGNVLMRFSLSICKTNQKLSTSVITTDIGFVNIKDL